MTTNIVIYILPSISYLEKFWVLSYQSNKFAISLQYLKKEISEWGHFLHGDKYQIFYNFALLFFMKVVRHVHSTQNGNLVIFTIY